MVGLFGNLSGVAPSRILLFSHQFSRALPESSRHYYNPLIDGCSALLLLDTDLNRNMSHVCYGVTRGPVSTSVYVVRVCVTSFDALHADPSIRGLLVHLIIIGNYRAVIYLQTAT